MYILILEGSISYEECERFFVPLKAKTEEEAIEEMNIYMLTCLLDDGHSDGKVCLAKMVGEEIEMNVLNKYISEKYKEELEFMVANRHTNYSAYSEMRAKVIGDGRHT